jgi:cytochrome c oxidase subunit 2
MVMLARRALSPRRLAIAGLVPVAAGCAPTSVTDEGEAIYGVYNLFLYIAAVVFVVVAGLLVWSMIRYRRRGDELPRQTHGNNRLELTWTLIPLLLVIVLFVVTIRAQDQALDRADRPALTIDVLAFQWSWRFTYEGQGAEVLGTPEKVPEMVVPVGQPVRFKLRSADVVHSFYVPRTLFKRQAIPGRTSEFDLTFERVGTYQGHCVQFCGLAHAEMLFRVRVVSQGEFQSWLATASRSGNPGEPGT